MIKRKLDDGQEKRIDIIGYGRPRVHQIANIG